MIKDKYFILKIAAITWVLSLVMPAAELTSINYATKTQFGYVFLFEGIMSIFYIWISPRELESWLTFLAWVSNIFLLLSFFHFRKERLSACLALAGALLAVSAFFINKLPCGPDFASLEVNFKIGFHFWIFAWIMLTTYSVQTLKNGCIGLRKCWANKISY